MKLSLSVKKIVSFGKALFVFGLLGNLYGGAYASDLDLIAGKWSVGQVTTLHCTESSSLVGFEAQSFAGVRYFSLPIEYDFCERLQADQVEARNLRADDLLTTALYLDEGRDGLVGFKSFVPPYHRAVLDTRLESKKRVEILKKLK